MPAAGGLSDALGRLASEEDRKPRQAREPEVEIRSAKALRADETTMLSVDQIIQEGEAKPKTLSSSSRPRRSSEPRANAPTMSSLAAAGSASSPTTATRRSSSPRGAKKAPNHDLKRTAIPILITVGVLLMVPGLWAVGQMLGFAVPRHEDPKAGQMALAMLITWPMSLCMIAGAVFFWVQTSGGKSSERRR